ncbi:hypothetical protein LOZ12_004840 [Ophidiomyces ophidiicola]|uniref:Uncharacterized protein n=1 Tax=Ophidiomyces ophidiicola TaxID=1387563 RepID=A0ACB8US86_9EURO|nr:hypothetical protein LOZ61_005671 [Ophidiomyces ophidiicola]KAI1920131.1 hypothetical protein LOZ65_004165 [Ophidiomyces ophidiicola]KAI1926429.1 hypothetical protein LOZ64_000192 [Ophidiomyces ophidiicola]KAI1940222.1 hypothetical protein LOZ62_004908 [Ophidiomyces ophidiicola]KAI1968992.1 hypothetical protein LOZ59_000016 [Ophidiomyces ophidiicola]
MRFLPLLVSVLTPLVAALQVTHPNERSQVVAGDDLKATWTFSDMDPPRLSLYLVNFVEYPPTYIPLAIDVRTRRAQFNVHLPCDTLPAAGYQINAVNGTNVYVIYAQSEHFKISPNMKKEDCFHDDIIMPTPTSTVFVTVAPTASPTPAPTRTP